MSLLIENNYYVGKGQPYATVNQAINAIATLLQGGNYQLPSTSAPDGGNVNIVLVGNDKFSAIKIPDNLTPPIKAQGRYLVIRRQDVGDNGNIISDALPVITPAANQSGDQDISNRLIGIDIGSNNPNVKIQGIRVQSFLIGISAGFNCHNLYINRCFVTNNKNAQIYIHNIEGLYLVNNLIVGGEYGIVVKYVKNIRCYHNTIFLDGLTALNGASKAGLILQGERTYGNSNPSTVYCLGNLVYTIGCPAAIFYEEDLKNNRLLSDYNDFYSQTCPVQLRSDNATLPQDEQEIVRKSYVNILDWRQAGPLGSSNAALIDQHSVSIHPVFIQNVSLLSNTSSSIVNLNIIDNSPLLGKVPSWFYSSDSFYIPSDFNTTLISVDSLLNTRQFPLTAIGANDKKSLNGFFGQDIFTSPLELDPSKKCNIDPLDVISAQELTMTYPAIKAGYFWSHERPFYLYGKKGAFNLGYLAKTVLKLPGILDTKQPLSIRIRDKEISEKDWDLSGMNLTIYHRNNNITSYNDEIQILGKVRQWYDNSFTNENAYYVFKIKDGITSFILPESYQAGAPVVITDDRIAFTNPIDAVYRDFQVVLDHKTHESHIQFGGNSNLLENSDFCYSYSGNTPRDWISKIQGNPRSVFILWNQFSYWGDKAVGLSVSPDPGFITSPQIDIHSNENLCFTWHAMLPTGITGTNGQSITGLSGKYIVTQFNNYDEEIPARIEGDFVVGPSYQRYYLPLGPADQIIDLSQPGLASAPLVYLKTGAAVLDDNVTKVELTLSGYNYSGLMSTGAFFALDAVQAEYSLEPSYYHPKPSFTDMTVEFETDQSGIFIDKRMNISPVFNENPNGFLYIADMPATIWGGPSDPEVTTLHEYRWPHGRMSVLPWARLYGKDKLHQRSVDSDTIGEPQNIISPYVFPKNAAQAVMSPSVLRVSQEAELPEGLSVQVLDTSYNPYSLRNYVAHVYDPNGNFPGWLSKKHYGAKEQLGSTIYGSLNSNGSFSCGFVCPDAHLVSYVGSVPRSLLSVSGLSGVVDSLSYISTRYNVSTENNGNITVVGLSGKQHKTLSDTALTGLYVAESNGDKSIITLGYPPCNGSVKVKAGVINFSETQVDPQSNEYRINYSYGQIELPAGTIDSTFYVEYRPKYAYPDPVNKNTIIFHHNQVFNDYSGAIQVDYDAELALEVRVSEPLNREFVATFPIILQNPKLSQFENQFLSSEF